MGSREFPGLRLVAFQPWLRRPFRKAWLHREGQTFLIGPIVSKSHDVTFSLPAGGLYMPSIGTVVPAGQYRGQITCDAAEHVVRVVLVLDRPALAQMNVEDGVTSLHCEITQDYLDGVIGEDWYV